MTDPLLDPTDYASFKAKSEAWFLGAAGETIRDHCGWHIAPIVSETEVQARIGGNGIILLPTMKLVSVDLLIINGAVLPGDAYEVFSAGFIVYRGFAGRRARGHTVSVSFTHGYEEVPKAVAEVGFELTGRTIEHPAGVLKHMTRGPTDLDFLEFGAVLSDDQKARLGPYTIVRV